MLVVMGESLAMQFYFSKHFWLIHPFLQSTHLGSLGQENQIHADLESSGQENQTLHMEGRSGIESFSLVHRNITQDGHHTYGGKLPGPGLHQESVVPDVHLHHHHYVVRRRHGCTA